MAREKFQTLTEKMYYIWIELMEECCGVDSMKRVGEITKGRVKVGAGTLYGLLDSFLEEGFICETRVEGRRRSYALTEVGRQVLEAARERLSLLIGDYDTQLRGSERG